MAAGRAEGHQEADSGGAAPADLCESGPLPPVPLVAGKFSEGAVVVGAPTVPCWPCNRSSAWAEGAGESCWQWPLRCCRASKRRGVVFGEALQETLCGSSPPKLPRLPEKDSGCAWGCQTLPTPWVSRQTPVLFYSCQQGQLPDLMTTCTSRGKLPPACRGRGAVSAGRTQACTEGGQAPTGR